MTGSIQSTERTPAKPAGKDIMAGIADLSAADLSGKYLTFKLLDEEYGLEILKVREIIGLLPITSLPKAPPFARGVINLRDKVIPVVDLRLKFDMDSVDDTEQTCIIVVDVASKATSVQIGILVDSVSEVLDIKGEDIEDPPSFGTDVNSAFILGMAKAKGTVKILLNIQKVLSPTEIEYMANAA